MSGHVIVTGGSGFLGTVLVEQLLDEGYPVTNLDLQQGSVTHNNLTTTIVDIADEAALAKLELPQGAHVVHLAGRQYDGPVKRQIRERFFREVNVEGTRLMTELARRIGAQSFSFVSTDMVYGRPQHSPVGIDHPRNPFGPYGASKVAAEDMIQSADLPFRALIYRPRLILGPGRFGLMSKLFSAIKNNMPVPMIGSGENVYQMVSVFDCADAIVCGIRKADASGVFNLGSAPGDPSKVLIRNLIKSVGSKSIVIPVPTPIIKPVLRTLDLVNVSPLVPEQFEIADQHYVLDVSRTEEILGWKPHGNDAEMMSAAYRRYVEVYS